MDLCNEDAKGQEDNYQLTLNNVQPFLSKVVMYRNYTSEVASILPDNSLDFIYVDARHDYCGVMEDISLYWPKLKPGGIMAGHDFLAYREILAFSLGAQDWSICGDGVTRNTGAVKGAVLDFIREEFRKRKLPVGICLTGTDCPNSWYFQKPWC